MRLLLVADPVLRKCWIFGELKPVVFSCLHSKAIFLQEEVLIAALQMSSLENEDSPVFDAG